MAPSDVSKARHNLRGRLNALKLCATALPMSETPEEAVEFLDLICSESDGVSSALDEFQQAFDAAGSNPS